MRDIRVRVLRAALLLCARCGFSHPVHAFVDLKLMCEFRRKQAEGKPLPVRRSRAMLRLFHSRLDMLHAPLGNANIARVLHSGAALSRCSTQQLNGCL